MKAIRADQRPVLQLLTGISGRLTSPDSADNNSSPNDVR